MIKKDMNLVYKTPAVKTFSVEVRRCMAQSITNEDWVRTTMSNGDYDETDY